MGIYKVVNGIGTPQIIMTLSKTLQDEMIREVGILFTKSLQRQPSRQEIGVSYTFHCYIDLFSQRNELWLQQTILKVLQQQGRNKQKFNKAKTFCYNRLTDFRCEERRRVGAKQQVNLC